MAVATRNNTNRRIETKAVHAHEQNNGPFDVPISNDNAIVSVSDLKHQTKNDAECKHKMTRKHNVIATHNAIE